MYLEFQSDLRRMYNMRWFANESKLEFWNIKYYVIFVYFFQLLKVSLKVRKKILVKIKHKKYLRFQNCNFRIVANQACDTLTLFCKCLIRSRKFRKLFLKKYGFTSDWNVTIRRFGSTKVMANLKHLSPFRN